MTGVQVKSAASQSNSRPLPFETLRSVPDIIHLEELRRWLGIEPMTS